MKKYVTFKQLSLLFKIICFISITLSIVFWNLQWFLFGVLCIFTSWGCDPDFKFPEPDENDYPGY